MSEPRSDMQLPDGRWVPAQPLPYYVDIRPWWLRLWHCLTFWRKRDYDEYLVPQEPSAAERYPQLASKEAQG